MSEFSKVQIPRTVGNSVTVETFDVKDAIGRGIRKTGTATVSSPNVTLSFSGDITIGTNSHINIYTDRWGVNPSNVTYTSSTVTVQFSNLTASVNVAVIVFNR